ncbi:putative RING finger protein [Pseudocercospora fuligena]|uniref:Putative RING finger protein n=1 Tax=Pseudocercospora fuligena TaxID=685502 RepID=A0A8H6RKP3_9PEZI|nr:putative RING finger protein [Pseudocercospora fuligena]
MALKSKEELLSTIKPTECDICHEPATEAYLTECRHLFCLECIKRWLENSALCPMCRRVLYEAENEDEEEVDDIERLELSFHNDQDEAIAARRYHGFQLGDHYEGFPEHENMPANEPCLIEEDDLLAYGIGTLLYFKPDRSRHGEFTEDQMCRDEWVLLAESIYRTIHALRNIIIPAGQLLSRLHTDWDILRYQTWPERHWRVPEYGPGLFEAADERGFVKEAEFVLKEVQRLAVYEAWYHVAAEELLDEARAFFVGRPCVNSFIEWPSGPCHFFGREGDRCATCGANTATADGVRIVDE